MIHIREEATKIRQGLSFYSLDCKHSAGFFIRVHKFIFRCRWSKIRHCWFIGYQTVDGKHHYLVDGNR